MRAHTLGMDTTKVLAVFGTRPEAIKILPVVRELAADSRFTVVVAITGQHREMVHELLRLFDVLPHYDFNILTVGQTLPEITSKALKYLYSTIEDESPDIVLVQGDTTTTFSGALAAFYAHVPVAHVEAGLRTGDFQNPFPEEMNRRLTTHLANLHFPPTRAARDALHLEGVSPDSVFVTGNTVIDALFWTASLRRPPTQSALQGLAQDDRSVLFVTAHRRESWGSGIASIAQALAALATGRQDLRIVFPLHPNPEIRQTVQSIIEGIPNITLLDPLPYEDSVFLMQACSIILTDSGGLQEEGPALGKPVLVTRHATERPEAIAAGTARLVGTSSDSIIGAVEELLDSESLYRRMSSARNPYGDGHASARIVAGLAHFLHGDLPPETFPGT